MRASTSSRPIKLERRIDRRRLRLAGHHHAQRHRDFRQLQLVLADDRLDRFVDFRAAPFGRGEACPQLDERRLDIGRIVLSLQCFGRLERPIEIHRGIRQLCDRVHALLEQRYKLND